MTNLTQVINFDKNLKTLKKTVHASDMDQLLSSSGPYTLFAPDDNAFQKLEKGKVESLLEPQNRSRLAALLNNHIVSGKIDFKELKDGDKLTTIHGRELTVHIKDGHVSVGDMAVQPKEVKITNGAMHVVDKVIIE